MKTIICLLLIFFSFNIYAFENKNYSCSGTLYILDSSNTSNEKNILFDLVLEKNNLSLIEKNSKHLILKNNTNFLLGKTGLFLTDSINNFSITFSLDKYEDKLKYHYTQSNNSIYGKIFSLGYCSIFDNDLNNI